MASRSDRTARTATTHFRLAALALSFVGLASTAPAASSATDVCVKDKTRAATKLLECLAKQENALLSGKPADFATCSSRFATSFAAAETRAAGGCATPGDLAVVEQRVQDAETEVLALLQASSAVTDAARRCVAAKNVAVARYASCNGAALARRILTRPPFVNGSDASVFRTCEGKRHAAFFRAEKRGACPTADDDVAVGAAANAVATASLSALDLAGLVLQSADLARANLAATNLSGADLRGADLAGADLTSTSLAGARLDVADLSGAVLDLADTTGAATSLARLDGCSWATTTCPDGVTASGPGACCSHLVGDPPASCTP